MGEKGATKEKLLLSETFILINLLGGRITGLIFLNNSRVKISSVHYSFEIEYIKYK